MKQRPLDAAAGGEGFDPTEIPQVVGAPAKLTTDDDLGQLRDHHSLYGRGAGGPRLAVDRVAADVESLG